MKYCENCGCKHDGSYGSGRFCSVKCSRGFSTKAKRKEINEKVSKSLRGNIPWNRSNDYVDKFINKICPQCNKKFEIHYSKRNQKCCSISCASKLRGGWINHNKVDWSAVNKKSYANGHNYVSGGTTKWYDYNGIKVQGKYELRTCFILDKWKESGKIKTWEYTKDRIEYIGIDNKKHSYLLDFKVFENNGSFYYVEVKGKKVDNDELKWKAVRNKGYKLEIWFKEDIFKK
jgi:hypothetical protein